MAKGNNGEKAAKGNDSEEVAKGIGSEQVAKGSGSEQVAKGNGSEPKRKKANVTCYKCREQGHYANECPMRKVCFALCSIWPLVLHCYILQQPAIDDYMAPLKAVTNMQVHTSIGNPEWEEHFATMRDDVSDSF